MWGSAATLAKRLPRDGDGTRSSWHSAGPPGLYDGGQLALDEQIRAVWDTEDGDAICVAFDSGINRLYIVVGKRGNNRREGFTFFNVTCIASLFFQHLEARKRGGGRCGRVNDEREHIDVNAKFSTSTKFSTIDSTY